jgi:putative heme-binding domain-containing protein
MGFCLTGKKLEEQLQRIFRVMKQRDFKSKWPFNGGSSVLTACPLALALIWFCHSEITTGQETGSLEVLVEVLKTSDDTSVQASLLKGMLLGLEGQRNVRAPKGWSKVSGKLMKSDDRAVRTMTLQLGQIFGDPQAIKFMLSTVRDPKADVRDRRTALKSLLSQQNKQVLAELESLLDQPAMQLDAIRAYSVLELAEAPRLLLDRYPGWDPAEQRAVIETLATRKSYAQALLAAMEAKTVASKDVPAYVARSLYSLLGDSFTKVYGEVRELAQDKTELIARYKKLLTPALLARADAGRGRVVYEKTCAACHILYDKGGKVGPNITGSNRGNLDYILLNLLDPSYDVPESYRMVVITTVNGRILSGVIAEEDNQRLVLKTAEQPTVVIPKQDIDLRKVSPLSLMPEGQLLKMKKDEVVNLIKYLQTDSQVEIPK